MNKNESKIDENGEYSKIGEEEYKERCWERYNENE